MISSPTANDRFSTTSTARQTFASVVALCEMSVTDVKVNSPTIHFAHCDDRYKR